LLSLIVGQIDQDRSELFVKADRACGDRTAQRLKIAVSGRNVQSDFTSLPETAILTGRPMLSPTSAARAIAGITASYPPGAGTLSAVTCRPPHRGHF
jgi:hypothetical protein